MGKYGPRPGSPRYRPPADLSDRILANVDHRADGCWLWTGFINPTGYGTLTVGSRVDGSYRPGMLAHRASYEALVGPVPDGQEIDHLCGNKACVNPAHLDPVTRSEHTKRESKRLTACRRGHPRTPENVYVDAQGRHHCLVCKRDRARARYHQTRTGVAG
jgi:hypothetical protein